MNYDDATDGFDKVTRLFERLSQPADENIDQRYREGHQAGFWKGVATVGLGVLVVGGAFCLMRSEE